MKKLVTLEVAAIALVGLTACTSQPTAPSTDSSTSGPSSASPTASTFSGTPTAPSSPSTATSAYPDTAEGAQAFVALYFSRVNEAWTKPQAGLVSPLCAGTSKSCASVEKVAQGLVQKKQKYDGPPVRLGSATVLGQFNASSVEVVSQALQEKRNIVDSAGSVVSTDQQKAVSNVFTLTWLASSWQIQKIENVQ